MEIKTYFFDTYAFFEIIDGNKNYKNYLTNISIVTTRLNLMELYYGLLLRGLVKEAEVWYSFLSDYAEEITDNTIKRAMRFRLENKKLDLSYADCIGYMMAIEKNIKFLTGDKGFEKFPNVEFVK